MTQEKKAKAYDEALDRAKKELQTCGSTDCDAARQIFRFFPELRESEDERIRKELIEYLTHRAEVTGFVDEDKDCKRWIAYLEKQKETANSFTDGVIEVRSFQRGIAEGRRLERQKECVADSSKTSADEGERIREGLVKLLTVASEAYLVESTGIEKSSYLAYLEKQKEQKPAQTVEEKEYVRTLKGLVSDFIRDSGGGITDVEYYQNICDWLDGRHIEQKSVVTHGETYHVDTLGTQQVIAGKMPQKPVERSLEDDHIIGFVYDLLNEIEWKDDWAMSKDECLRLLSNYIPQKSAEWSEEDEEMLNSCISSIEEAKENRYAYKETDGDTSYDYEIAWLKSLRPQSKYDIYKEKDKAYKLGKHHLAVKFMNYLDENRPEGKMSLSNGECEDIDKAFKENDLTKIMGYADKYRPSWKPSEAQLMALHSIIDDESDTIGNEQLKSLYNDLKKLM